jgi:hypothetical protein
VITSFATIAHQAAAAAAQWKPGQPAPRNPYCPHTQPEHHAEWKRRFEVALVRTSIEESA